MAASVTAFLFYNKFREELGRGNVDLSTIVPKAQLIGSTSNVTDATTSTLASVTGTVTGAGYTGPLDLVLPVWTVGVSAGAWRFDSNALTWSANAAVISGVKYVQFYQSLGVGTGLPIGYIQLLAAAQDVSAGNTVVVTPNPYWFRLS